jgi:hypothetical protein
MVATATGSNKPDKEAESPVTKNQPVPPTGGAPNEAAEKALLGNAPASDGFKGTDGFDLLDSSKKESKGDLLKRAQVRAPSLTQEFVDAYSLSDEVLTGIADGLIPPPPAIGPIHTSDLYLTPGGWQQTPIGVAPADVGPNRPDGRF